MKLIKVLFRVLFLALYFTYNSVSAQEVDFNNFVPLSISDSSSYIDKLVYWSWHNHPKNWVLDHEIEKATKKVKVAKYDWTKNVSATFNINERTIDNDFSRILDAQSANNVYPRYNFGVRLTIADLVVKPAEVKMAKYDLLISKENLNEQKLLIRTEVVRRYENYLLKKEVLKFKVKTEEELKLVYSRATDRFKKGDLTLEDYTTTLNVTSRASEDRTIAEMELRVSKAELEEIVGTQLELIK